MRILIFIYSMWALLTFILSVVCDESSDDFTIEIFLSDKDFNIVSKSIVIILYYISFPGCLVLDVLCGAVLLLSDKQKFLNLIRKKSHVKKCHVKKLEEKIDLCMQNIINLQDELYHTKEELKEIQNYICVNDMKGE